MFKLYIKNRVEVLKLNKAKIKCQDEKWGQVKSGNICIWYAYSKLEDININWDQVKKYIYILLYVILIYYHEVISKYEMKFIKYI